MILFYSLPVSSFPPNGIRPPPWRTSSGSTVSWQKRAFSILFSAQLTASTSPMIIGPVYMEKSCLWQEGNPLTRATFHQAFIYKSFLYWPGQTLALSVARMLYMYALCLGFTATPKATRIPDQKATRNPTREPACRLPPSKLCDFSLRCYLLRMYEKFSCPW